MFGPCQGAVVLGADAARATITLDAGLGILPVHTTLTPRGAGWVLAPSEGAAAVYLVRGGARRLDRPSVIQPGDRFLLGSLQGPGFTAWDRPPVAAAPAPVTAGRAVSAGAPAPSTQPGRAGPGRAPPTAGALGREVVRRGEVELMRHGAAQDAARWYHRWRGGTLFQPHVIVGALFALGSMMVAGCGGISAIVWKILHDG